MQAWTILLFPWLVVRLEQDSYYYVLRREASDAHLAIQHLKTGISIFLQYPTKHCNFLLSNTRTSKIKQKNVFSQFCSSLNIVVLNVI
jgi:hypothetical protein